MTDKEKLAAWENAYMHLARYGHIGRVFKGTVHNLNGVVQAFSMQTELFELMFTKFRKLLTPLFEEPLSPQMVESLNTVLKLVAKREKMLGPMVDKIAYSQEIIKNTENICQRPLEGEALSLQVLVKNVIGFYQSDMYFKHKVKVTTDLQSNYIVESSCPELGLVLQNMIQNSITALVFANVDEPKMSFICNEDDTHMRVHIRDNGGGVDPEVCDTLYDPFVTSIDGQPGLGLYFCQQICNKIGYSIHYEMDGEWTDFIVTIPK